MEVTINYNGQAVAVEVTLEVYEFLDRADHKTENLFHEQRRHWDGREFDEYIAFTEGVGVYSETPEEYLCRMETLHELMAVLDTFRFAPNNGHKKTQAISLGKKRYYCCLDPNESAKTPRFL